MLTKSRPAKAVFFVFSNICQVFANSLKTLQ